MATTTTKIGFPFAANMAEDTDLDETIESNMIGPTPTVYTFDVETTDSTVSYIKIYDAKTATVGTTAPSMVFMVPPTSRRSIVIPAGLAFVTAISAAAVAAGGTAGTSGPSNFTKIRIIAT